MILWFSFNLLHMTFIPNSKKDGSSLWPTERRLEELCLESKKARCHRLLSHDFPSLSSEVFILSTNGFGLIFI